MDDDEAMLTLVLGPTDVVLPIVVAVEVLLLICSDTVLTEKVVDTADVTLTSWRRLRMSQSTCSPSCWAFWKRSSPTPLNWTAETC